MAKYSCIVVGYGSIGKRHARILNDLGHHVTVVSRRKIEYSDSFPTIREALSNQNVDYVVVANETSNHFQTLKELESLNFNKKILVEKPLYSRMNNSKLNITSIFVGYNLRFHPIIQQLSKEIQNKKIVSVQCYVGQYLPNWRPGTNYSKSYSANKSSGGGVLRDLSHELDYMLFLFGGWKEMAVLGGKFSELKIDSDDHFSFIFNTKKVPLISLQMNYLDHITQRHLVINTNDTTYKADFINNTLQINDKLIQYQVERDYTYKMQHTALLNNDKTFLCSYIQGLSVVSMIEIAEAASDKKEWVSNDKNMYNLC